MIGWWLLRFYLLYFTRGNHGEIYGVEHTPTVAFLFETGIISVNFFLTITPSIWHKVSSSAGFRVCGILPHLH
ncbi:hypothetical protein MicvaDRAFT_1332 [Microcoleus vaginatus FGP-2]|nr:hypothetical protein MicvaDRAFT_1332 [Microcoleus vaginatus FGP-2]